MAWDLLRKPPDIQDEACGKYSNQISASSHLILLFKQTNWMIMIVVYCLLFGWEQSIWHCVRPINNIQFYFNLWLSNQIIFTNLALIGPSEGRFCSFGTLRRVLFSKHTFGHVSRRALYRTYKTHWKFSASCFTSTWGIWTGQNCRHQCAI